MSSIGTQQAPLSDLQPTDAGRSHQPLPAVSIGDAFDKVLGLSESSVDCVVTSPPYWGLRSYGHVHDESVLDKWASAHPLIARRDLAAHAPGYDWYRANGGVLGLEPYPQWFIGHLVEIFERIKPAMKPTGSVWVNLGDTYFARWSSIRSDGRQGLGQATRTRRRTPSGGELVDKQLLLVPARFAIAMQDAGWILRNDLIWAKPAVPPRAEGDRLRLSHEHFFHFVLRPATGRAKYFYDASAAEEGANDVVRVGPQKGSDGHSATFPKELVRPRIETSCPPGGLVLDPFCGTGRALEAAIESGRRAHGIELSENYARAARRRVREAKERRLAETVNDR